MIGNVKSLRELFEIELRYAYDCEQKLAKKGIPTMIESTSSPDAERVATALAGNSGPCGATRGVVSTLGVDSRDTKGNDVIDEIMSAAKDSVSNMKLRRFATPR